MKKLMFIVVAVMATGSVYAQKAKLDEFYKTKKSVYTLSANNAGKAQVSAKEAMKMDVVKYNRVVSPSDISQTTNSKFMALSKKEQMKREVVKINTRNVKPETSNLAIDKKQKLNAPAIEDKTAE